MDKKIIESTLEKLHKAVRPIFGDLELNKYSKPHFVGYNYKHAPRGKSHHWLSFGLIHEGNAEFWLNIGALKSKDDFIPIKEKLIEIQKNLKGAEINEKSEQYLLRISTPIKSWDEKDISKALTDQIAHFNAIFSQLNKLGLLGVDSFTVKDTKEKGERREIKKVSLNLEDRIAEIEKKEAELTKRESELNRKEAQLNKREAELNKKETETSKRNKSKDVVSENKSKIKYEVKVKITNKHKRKKYKYATQEYFKEQIKYSDLVMKWSVRDLPGLDDFETILIDFIYDPKVRMSKKLVKHILLEESSGKIFDNDYFKEQRNIIRHADRYPDDFKIEILQYSKK